MTVCLANRARSPTAEWLLHRNYKVKSCGTAEFDATKPCDKYDMKWANRVLVMEPYQKENLEMRFPNETRGGKVELLDVPEVGKYSCQPSLLIEIADRLREHNLKVRNIKDVGRASNECMVWTSQMADRKMRAKQQRSYALTDFWDTGKVETDEMPLRERKLEPWQIEEEKAFMRASQAGRHGQGGIARVVEDDAGMKVFFGGKELTPEEVNEMFVDVGDEAVIPITRPKKTEKLVGELKKYADEVKKFFQS